MKVKNHLFQSNIITVSQFYRYNQSIKSQPYRIQGSMISQITTDDHMSFHNFLSTFANRIVTIPTGIETCNSNYYYRGIE